MQSQNATKAAQRAATENLEEELTQYDSLAFLVILFFNLASMASSSRENSRVARLASLRMGKSNGEFATGKEESMGGGTPPANQVEKVVEVPEVGQAAR